MDGQGALVQLRIGEVRTQERQVVGAALRRVHPGLAGHGRKGEPRRPHPVGGWWLPVAGPMLEWWVPKKT
ncbi:hypothetical protein GCM10010215_49670 [Streptomyces virginiae]|uniref:Uncharacterized protein n=1 Tax=Streptomyces virginiae TaxID=1961 RepID=A0ABQ3NGQ8_STRVG|nr:hypothetical protein GCM10010215_49670 [Streptomyces virginiae]GHI11943.1 hypothetical protein Scinn_14060 [Streptomyces virginiae]